MRRPSAHSCRRGSTRTVRILTKSKKLNLSRAEKQNIYTLQGNDDFTFLPADKGHAMAVNTVEYVEKVLALMDD
jgi:hypothetical protein